MLQHYAKHDTMPLVFIILSVVTQHLRLQGGSPMEQRIEIPQMSEDDIVKWYSTIRPIVHQGTKFTFLRELSWKELTSVGYTFFNDPNDYAENVDFSTLSFLADVKMLHEYGYPAFFHASVAEVIRQIPTHMLNEAVAFEIIYSPHTSEHFSLFKQEFNAGFHVSIVRLYKTRVGTSVAAEPMGVFINDNVWRPAKAYPTENSMLPIGMTEEEFNNLKQLLIEEVKH